MIIEEMAALRRPKPAVSSAVDAFVGSAEIVRAASSAGSAVTVYANAIVTIAAAANFMMIGRIVRACSNESVCMTERH